MNTSIFKSIIFIITIQLLAFLPMTYGIHISFNNYCFSDSLTSDLDSLEALALEHHLWAAHNYKVQLDSAIKRGQKALEIRKQLFSDKPTIDLGKSYHNMGVFLSNRGELTEAKESFKEAVLCYTLLNQERMMRSLLGLGKIYKLEGDYDSAEKYFREVIKHAKRNENFNKIREGVVNLGATLIDAKKDSMAILLLEKNESYFLDNSDEYKEVNGKFYNNLASAYNIKHLYDDAIRTYLKASEIDEADFGTLASIYNNLAMVYLEKGDDVRCLEAIEKGKSFAMKSKDVKLIAYSYRGPGKFYETKNEYRNALSEYQKSIITLLPSFEAKDDFENPVFEDFEFCVNKIDLLHYFSSKVDVMILMEDTLISKSIIELFKLGDELIANIRQDQFINDIKLHWRKEVFAFYEKAISYCHKQHMVDDAFYFIEKTKSVVLLEGYSFNEAISKILPKHKIRYEKLKLIAANSRNSNFYSNAEDLVVPQRSFEIFVDTLSLFYPSLFKKYKDQPVVTLDSVQSNIVDDSTLFIHYFYGEEQIYALTIDSEKGNLYNLGANNVIDSLITNFSSFFLQVGRIENDLLAYKRYSHTVYLKILEPLLNARYKNIVIVPDGKIGIVPFDALVTSLDTVAQNSKYVIDDLLIRLSFSSSCIKHDKVVEQSNDYDLVAFTPYSIDSNYRNTSFSGVDRKMFKSDIGRLIKVKYVEGNDASLSELLTLDEQFSILHFSSHGLSGTDGDASISLSNSSISLSELYTMNLPVDLVFLSTCKSSLGREAFGEGIQSMARGFRFAGASSVVSSLWNVVAQPNSKIVTSFYRNIANGFPKHIALNEAKKSYLKDPTVPAFEKSPYYWGGLVYYGEDNKVQLTAKADHFYVYSKWFLSGLFVILCFFLFRRFR